MIRRPGISWTLLVGLAVVLAAVVAVSTLVGGQAKTVTLDASVDFSRPVATTNEYAAGVGASTYGATPLDSSAEQAAERRLGARFVRIPVAVRNGQVVSGAAGGSTVDVRALVERYLSWGDHVLVVIAGATNDFDVQPGDTTTIVTALGYGPDVQYSTPNEPTGQGKSVQDDIAVAREILSEGRALYPDFRVWGPAWAYYDRSSISAFITAIGSGLAGIDFHHYAMGETSLSPSAALAGTPSFGSEVAATYRQLRAAGSDAQVAVDELNWSWRYNDGAAGEGDNRFFTAANTVWIASACGHVLSAGGRCLPYATQNGALGMTVEDGGPDPDNRPASSPMPAYWGLATWTGASRFPGVSGDFYSTGGPGSDVEVFASGNDAGGRNIVVINKSSRPRIVALRLRGVRPGTYRLWRSAPAAPYDAPTSAGRSSYTTSIRTQLDGMSVAVAVLRPKR